MSTSQQKKPLDRLSILTRELIDQAETACAKNPHQMIGWLAAKCARALIAAENGKEEQ